MEGGEDELLVESFEPAQNWNEALPLGSGRLGAMVFGGVKSELVQLNGKRPENSVLWSLIGCGSIHDRKFRDWFSGAYTFVEQHFVISWCAFSAQISVMLRCRGYIMVRWTERLEQP